MARHDAVDRSLPRPGPVAAQPARKPPVRHPADVLAGRDSQLASLRRAISTTRRGGQVFVELVGEPGIGKTRLLQEGTALAGAAGVDVVAATCGELLSNVPHTMVTPLLRRLGIGLGVDGQLDTATSRAELHRAVRHGLAELATAAPVALVFDDVHWADPASLDLLVRLLHDPPAAPLLVLIAYRDRQEPAALATASGLLDRAVGHLRLTMAPMSVTEFGQLLNLRPGERLNRLHASAGGNPLYGQVLAAYPDHGAVPAAAGDLNGPAASQRAIRALRSELAGLDGAARELLYTAAVAGEAFSPDVVAAASALPGEAATAAMEHLIGRDLVREDQPHSTELRFRHPVLRALAYRELTATRRRLLHGRLATVLRDRGAGQALLAVHVARSAESGDLVAVELLVACAERIGPHAPGTAAEYLEAARSLTSRCGLDPALRARIDLNLARVYMWAGELAAARESLQGGAPADAPPQERIQYTLTRARVERLLGHHQEALAVVRSELTANKPDDPIFEVMLALEAATAAAMWGSRSAVEFIAQAQQAVAGVADRAFHIAVTIVRAFLAALWGGDQPAIDDLASAVVEIDALPDGHLVHLMDPLGLLGWAEMQLERDRDALRHFDRAVAIANRTGHVDLLPHLLVGRSYATSRLGLLAESAEAAEDAVEAARRLGTAAALGLALNFLATVRGYLRGPDAARELAAEAVAATRYAGREWLTEVAQRTAVRIRYAAGDSFDAVAALTKACGGADLAWVEVCTRPYWCAVLAELSDAAGRSDAAVAWVGKGAAFAEEAGLPGATAHVNLARARLAASRGDFRAAYADASAASGSFSALGWIPTEIGSRQFLAGVHAKLGQWDQMFAELAEARRLAEITGSAWLRQAVIAEQRRLASAAGVNPGGQQTPGSGLSRREAEIARLAITGATNNEIAARLHVTPKTVEAHLSRTYRKLGVRSRAMLAAALAPSPPTT